MLGLNVLLYALKFRIFFQMILGDIIFFGTKGGYYDTDKYDGDGTAHKVLK